MGFPGGVVQYGHALRPGGSQHDVDGAAYGYTVKVDRRPPHDPFGGDDGGVILHLRAQRAEALDMLLKGTLPDGAAARIGHAARPAAAQQRADQIIAGAHAGGVFVADGVARYAAGIHLHPAFFRVVGDLRPQRGQNVLQHAHIFNVRHVFQRAGFVAEQRGRDHRNGRVFAAGHERVARQGLVAVDQQLVIIHRPRPPLCVKNSGADRQQRPVRKETPFDYTIYASLWQGIPRKHPFLPGKGRAVMSKQAGKCPKQTRRASLFSVPQVRMHPSREPSSIGFRGRRAYTPPSFTPPHHAGRPPRTADGFSSG